MAIFVYFLRCIIFALQERFERKMPLKRPNAANLNVTCQYSIKHADDLDVVNQQVLLSMKK